MREHRILFSDAVWEIVQEQAEAQGISAAQFVREACLVWALWHAERGDAGEDLFERAWQELRQD